MKKGIIVSVDTTDATRGTLADGSYVFGNKNLGGLKVGNAITYETVRQTQTYEKDAQGQRVIGEDGKPKLIPVPLDQQRDIHQIRAVFENPAAMSKTLGESASLDNLIAMEGKAIAASNVSKLAATYNIAAELFN